MTPPAWFKGDLTAWAIHVAWLNWNCVGVLQELRRAK